MNIALRAIKPSHKEPDGGCRQEFLGVTLLPISTTYAME